MAQARPPLDYRGPPTPGGRRVGRNFAAGLGIGFAADVVPLAVTFASGSGDAGLVTLAAVVVGKVVAAGVVAQWGGRSAFAPGILVSLGVALLVYGGLCFYAIQHF